jgi:hypothetical protein
MAMVDQKGKLFGKMNIIDLGIILVVILCLAAGGYWLYARNAKTDSVGSKPLYFNVELTGKTKEFVDSIQKDGEVEFNFKEKGNGKVVEKLVKPSRRVSQDSVNGKFVMADVPELYDVIITVETKGKEEPKRFISDKLELRVGSGLYVKGSGYTSFGFILSVGTSK